MKNIDERRLNSDLAYRFDYLTEFMGFGAEDIAAIHGAAEHLGPLVPTLVDAVYDKLFQYSSTWRHFVPRQHGYEGQLPTDLESLAPDSEVIAFRKQHLARYLGRLVTKPYDAAMLNYLDVVGSIHTPDKGNPEISIPLVQMNALLGFVADAFVATIMGLPLDDAGKTKTLRAFTKLLWLQNDLINRHYVAETARPTPA